MQETELKQDLTQVPVNVTLEEDLINKFLYAMVRGEHVFLTKPDETGARYTAIKVSDVLEKFKNFKTLWDNRYVDN
jgi:hypothetical protein